MSKQLTFNTLLVPTDFSPPSRHAFDQSIHLATGENPAVILLHVIDPSLVEFSTLHELGSREEIVARMRQRAEIELSLEKERVNVDVDVEMMVSEGVPFMEILQKAEDFAVDAILIGKIGMRGTVEKLLFGSTAEKVIRGSRWPVIILPSDS